MIETSFEALPSAATVVAYALAVVVLVVTPGPDMALFLGRTIAGGRRSGYAVLAGTTAGLYVHTGLAAFGLSALIAASPAAFTALKSGASSARQMNTRPPIVRTCTERSE